MLTIDNHIMTEEEGRTHNSGFAKVGHKCYFEHWEFY